jgi:hypothetical protein
MTLGKITSGRDEKFQRVSLGGVQYFKGKRKVKKVEELSQEGVSRRRVQQVLRAGLSSPVRH